MWALEDRVLLFKFNRIMMRNSMSNLQPIINILKKKNELKKHSVPHPLFLLTVNVDAYWTPFQTGISMLEFNLGQGLS
jgi:hypothetical protein